MYTLSLVAICTYSYLRNLSLNKSIDILEAYFEREVFSKKQLLTLIEKMTDLLPDHQTITTTFSPYRSGYYAFDGVWFKYRGRDLVLLICFDVVTLDIVAYKLAIDETYESYQALLKPIPHKVKDQIKGIFTDGEPGLLKILKEQFPQAPIQLCVFHKYTRAKQIIPFKRGGKVDKEIRNKVSKVLFAQSKKEAIDNLTELERYAQEQQQGNKKLKQVIGALKRNFQLLLTHFDNPQMSPYNNVLEGFNHLLKTRLRLMKGFKKPINIQRWIKLMLLDYRFHRFKESSKEYRYRNGKCPLQLAHCNLPKYYNWIKFLIKTFRIKDKQLLTNIN